MFKLALQNLFRRPVRFALTVAGLTIAMAVWAGLAAFGEGYQRLLRRELDQSGMHLALPCQRSGRWRRAEKSASAR